MNLRNKVQLIGRLGQNPEVKEFNEQNKLAKFSIATTEVYKNQQGEKVEDTQWHNIVAWGRQAEFVENYLSKGQEVVISGKLVSRSYDDKEGNKRYVTEVQAQDFLMVGK